MMQLFSTETETPTSGSTNRCTRLMESGSLLSSNMECIHECWADENNIEKRKLC